MKIRQKEERRESRKKKKKQQQKPPQQQQHKQKQKYHHPPQTNPHATNPPAKAQHQEPTYRRKPNPTRRYDGDVLSPVNIHKLILFDYVLFHLSLSF